MIRVVVADDHHLVRQGIRALLEKAADISVVGEAADGHQAVELVRTIIPSVLILDVMMPGLNGTDVLKRIAQLSVKTRSVMVSMYSDETLVRQSLANGATGYLLKRSVMEELLLAVRAAHRGESYLSPEISRFVLGSFLTPSHQSHPPNPLEVLTLREREVLKLIAEGSTNASAAAQLGVSEKTVEKHRTHLMAKLNIHNLAGLVRFAVKHGLVALD